MDDIPRDEKCQVNVNVTPVFLSRKVAFPCTSGEDHKHRVRPYYRGKPLLSTALGCVHRFFDCHQQSNKGTAFCSLNAVLRMLCGAIRRRLQK